MRKIVLVNQTSGFLVIDNLNACCSKYDEVVLICGSLVEGERPLNSKVKVSKICKYDRTSSFKRFSTWLYGTLQIFIKLLFMYRNYEVMYYTNPPLSYFCSMMLRNEFSIVEYDIYPDVLRTIGINDCSPIYRIWENINRRIFSKSKKIITLSEGMKRVLSHYVVEDKIKIIPLWSASEAFKPLQKNENPFLVERQLEGKFIVLYSGNIGYTHSVEVLVEVADRIKNIEDVVILIIGEGKKKQEIIDDVNNRGLKNVIILPYQEFSMLPYSLASADLGIVTLDENVSKFSVPSKTFNLMAVGAPLLAISNNDTEISRLVNRYNNGRCIAKANVDDMVKYILELKNNPEKKKQYSNNSLESSKCFTYKNAELYFE